MALGAIGIALGALLAASVPPTRREDEMLGEASDRMTDKLRHKAEEGYQKMSAKGEEVAAQVKQQSAEHGEATRPNSSSASTTGSNSAGL